MRLIYLKILDIPILVASGGSSQTPKNTCT